MPEGDPKSREHLETACRDLEARLKDLREEVAASCTTEPIDGIHRLRAEECVLRAQLAALKTNPPTAGFVDRRILQERAIEEVCRSNTGLERTLERFQQQKKELEAWSRASAEEVERLKALLQRFKDMPLDRQAARAESEEVELYRQRSKEIEEHLLDFLEAFYPQPTTENLIGQQKKAKRSRGLSRTDLPSANSGADSLQTLLEELCSRAIRHPEDPFVPLTARTWPPYVELLRRCGIIGEHPDDSSRIKLLHGHT